MWRRAGGGHGIPGWPVACFAGSILALGLALTWPLDALGESLFAAHVGQHLVLMVVAAPLLIVAAPLAPALARRRGQPVRCAWRWSLGRWLLTPLMATLLQLLALYAWHTPAAIAAALGSDGVHATTHVSLLGTALLFWSAISRAGRFGYSLAERRAESD